MVVSTGEEDADAASDDEDASCSDSNDGGTVDWTLVEDAGGEDAWEVLSFASLHPASEKQRIKDRNKGSKRFMMFTSL